MMCKNDEIYASKWGEEMKIAVVGSRTLSVENLADYLPRETSGLISGGAKGIDTGVRAYAECTGLPLKEFLPDYRRYGRGAPLKRNEQIVAAADGVIAFWDGASRGTAYVIALCRKNQVPVTVYQLLDGRYQRIDESVYFPDEQKLIHY